MILKFCLKYMFVYFDLLLIGDISTSIDSTSVIFHWQILLGFVDDWKLTWKWDSGQHTRSSFCIHFTEFKSIRNKVTSILSMIGKCLQSTFFQQFAPRSGGLHKFIPWNCLQLGEMQTNRSMHFKNLVHLSFSHFFQPLKHQDHVRLPEPVGIYFVPSGVHFLMLNII